MKQPRVLRTQDDIEETLAFLLSFVHMTPGHSPDGREQIIGFTHGLRWVLGYKRHERVIKRTKREVLRMLKESK